MSPIAPSVPPSSPAARPPEPGVTPVSAEALRVALVAANRDTSPHHVRDGAAEGTDLVAEWRLLDPRWHGTFSRAALRRVGRLHLLLDEASHTAREYTEELGVEWMAAAPGAPALPTPRLLPLPDETGAEPRVDAPLAGAIGGYTEQLPSGRAYSYLFATDELREPIADLVCRSGWRFQPALARSAVARARSIVPAFSPASSLSAPARPVPVATNLSVPSYHGLGSTANANMQVRPGNPMAVAGFVCGLCGLVPFWIGFLLCILAITFSAIGMSRASQRGGVGRGLAIAGLVIGLVFIIPAAFGL